MELWRILTSFLLNMVHVVIGSGFTIQPALLPQLAVTKRMSEASIGVLFGMQALLLAVSFFVCLPLLPKFGFRVCIFGSLAGTAFSTTLYGFVEFLPKGWTFEFPCYVITVTQAAFVAAASILILTYLVELMPDHQATAIGTFAFSATLAHILGRSVFGAVKEYLTFFFPFVIIGVLTFHLTALCVVMLPLDSDSNRCADMRSATMNYLSAFRRLLRRPAIILSLVQMACIMLSGGSVSVFLELFLIRQFNARAGMVGLVFALSSVGPLLSPFFGYLCDRFSVSRQLEVLAFAITGLGLFLFDPMPFLHIQPRLWLTMVGVTLQGIAWGIFTPCMGSDLLKEAKLELSGQSEEVEDKVSNLFLVCQSASLSIASVIGGCLFHWLGPSLTTAILGHFEWFVGLVLLVSWLSCGHCGSRRNSHESLGNK